MTTEHTIKSKIKITTASLADCSGYHLQEVYLSGTGVTNPRIPDDIESPLLLNKDYPIGEVVHSAAPLILPLVELLLVLVRHANTKAMLLSRCSSTSKAQ